MEIVQRNCNNIMLTLYNNVFAALVGRMKSCISSALERNRHVYSIYCCFQVKVNVLQEGARASIAYSKRAVVIIAKIVSI